MQEIVSRALYLFQCRLHALKQSKDISPGPVQCAASPLSSDRAQAAAKSVAVNLSAECPQINTKIEVKTDVEGKSVIE